MAQSNDDGGLVAVNSESIIGHRSGIIRIVVAGGGTGGHISPAVAAIEELRSRMEVEAIWMGSHGGFERQAADNLGIPFHPVRTGKLRRYASAQTLLDSVRVPWGIAQARSILRGFRPDLVFSTGGFVSVPSVIAARALGIPSLTHEQTAYIGLATKINARFCQTIALSFERSEEFLPRHGARVIVTGNPIRRIVLNGNATNGRARFNVPNDLPIVYVTGGAQGSSALNSVIFGVIRELLGYVALIHQTGSDEAHSDFDTANHLRMSLPIDLRRRYHPIERIGAEIGDLYAATMLVIGRAGAGTVNEIAALSIPSILIPLPGAEEQRQNALYLVERGTARLIPQDELTPAVLVEAVTELVENADRLVSMRSVEPDPRPVHAAGKLADEILRLANARGGSAAKGDVDRLVH